MLSEMTVKLKRDIRDVQKPLEKIFATLMKGDGFGQQSMLHLHDKKKKFYSAIALSDCQVLQLTQIELLQVLKDKANRQLQERMLFVKTIPELSKVNQRSKLNSLCDNLQPISCIKGVKLFSEGEQCKLIYLIRSGEIQQSIRVQMPKIDQDGSEALALLREPYLGRINQIPN